jgi:hypothetical protein
VESKDTSASFSVILLNEQMEVFGETIMPFQIYDLGSFFISEYGLFIALHVNHPEFDPDGLKHARFTVEQNAHLVTILSRNSIVV